MTGTRTTILGLALLMLVVPLAAQEKQNGDTPASSWWNDSDLIELLELTEEQRESMDAHLEAFRGNPAVDVREEIRGQVEALGEAMTERDWRQAQVLSRRIGDLRQGSLDAYLQLKIEVFSVLSEEQWNVLRDRRPDLIRGRWGISDGLDQRRERREQVREEIREKLEERRRTTGAKKEGG